MINFEVGDKVLVIDQGLLRLHSLMPKGTKPNYFGTVNEIMSDGNILVQFPLGDDDPEEHSQVAPYPPHLVRKR